MMFISGRPNLMDLKSTNGTKLNGQDVTPGEYYKLSDGDKIKFGESTREFLVRELE
jgi:smad nuclear-interacting protein 1